MQLFKTLIISCYRGMVDINPIHNYNNTHLHRVINSIAAAENKMPVVLYILFLISLDRSYKFHDIIFNERHAHE